jgi:hypothetical protein
LNQAPVLEPADDHVSVIAGGIEALAVGGGEAVTVGVGEVVSAGLGKNPQAEMRETNKIVTRQTAIFFLCIEEPPAIDVIA